MHLRRLALPTPEEVLRELPDLLAASGALLSQRYPERADLARTVSPWLSPAFANPDEDTDFEPFSEIERAYLERQIERTHRDLYFERPRSPNSPWRLKELAIAPLTDWSNRNDGTGVIFLEVPIFTTDRCQALLRGQLQGFDFAQDFQHWLQKADDQWTLS